MITVRYFKGKHYLQYESESTSVCSLKAHSRVDAWTIANTYNRKQEQLLRKVNAEYSVMLINHLRARA